MIYRTVVLLALVVPACLIVGGCDAGESSDGYAEGEYDDTPEGRARENSEEGAAALAESDRGVDEEGERLWKEPAAEYYRGDSNLTFEMPRDWAAGFAERILAAGAEAVWVTRITAEELGGRHFNMSDDLLIVLPQDPAKRKAVFALYNGEMEDEELQFPDVGQNYIFIVAD